MPTTTTLLKKSPKDVNRVYTYFKTLPFDSGMSKKIDGFECEIGLDLRVKKLLLPATVVSADQKLIIDLFESAILDLFVELKTNRVKNQNIDLSDYVNWIIKAHLDQNQNLD
jgi:hypothetical protein